ncbi:MAG: AMP-binding protein [Actinobacteria bacterium]|nr:AMP-binding protein [Actinomycetota bacterium]
MNAAVAAEVAEWAELYAGEGIDLGHCLCDVHAERGADALLYDGPGGRVELSYADLRDRSRRLAGALRAAGVEPGDRVAVMLPKSPEVIVALLAIWRLGAVEVPLFTAFGPEAATYRALHSGARIAITDAANRAKLDEACAAGVRVMTVAGGDGEVAEGDLDFAAAVRDGESFAGVTRSGEEMMILLYTSGTTGQPKGVEFPVGGLAAVRSYMVHGLDLRPDDVFWNIADHGWAYGLWYTLVGPLLLGRRIFLSGRPFDPAYVFEKLAELGVTNFAGAPTAIRAMRAMRAPAGFRERNALRVCSSAGEPLNPELLDWSRREMGVEVHDHYGQSETGMTAGFYHDPRIHREPLPGATGFAAPGFRLEVVDGDGTRCAPGVDGEMVIDVRASPLFWFRRYFKDPERTAERFPFGERYYLTGDAAAVDADGIFRFASRVDDVIISAGYRIGPFEVESALVAHPSVAEVAVIGTPDELRGEAVTAFVVLVPGVEPEEELAAELQQFVKSTLAKHLYPRHVVFAAELPRTPSGKVRRTVLRERWSEVGPAAGTG